MAYRFYRLAVVVWASLGVACGSEAAPPANSSLGGSGGAGGSNGGGAGSPGSGGIAGSTTGGSAGATTGGDDGGTTSGAGGTGGSGATGGTGATGSTGTGATGGSGAEGGSSGSGGSGPGGTGGSAGTDGGAPPDGGTVAPPRCKPQTAWIPLARVASIPNEHLGRFGGVSPDELTAAWTSGSGDVYVADRPTYRDPFGTPIKVNTAALATDRVAIASTANSLIAVRDDRAAFVGFERPARDAAWMPSTGLEFTQVRVVFEGGALVSDPVLSADKGSFFFVVTPLGQPPAVFEAAWDATQRSWGLPANIPNVELQAGTGGKRRRPTGTSSDGRTLFFFDEAANVERAAWRDAPAAPFSLFKDIGAFPEGVPSQRCDTLYYQGQDALGAGVFIGE